MELRSKRDEVVELVNKLFVYTDQRQWSKLLSDVFKERVLFDMSSMGAGEPKELPAKAICDMWDEGFKDIDHVHHQSGNFIVEFHNDDEQVNVFCYALAFHYRKNASRGATRQFVGSYHIHASLTDVGWRIDRFKYNLKYIDGNADLK